MSGLALHSILLAQSSPFEKLAREFQGRQTRVESGYLTTGLLCVLAILLGAWLLSKVVERYDRQRPINSSWMLFLSLCKAHQLRWPERWLLWRVAREQRLKDPARLFLEPERFHPANAGPFQRLRAAQLDVLRERLFVGVPAGSSPPSEPPNGQEKPVAPTSGGGRPTSPPFPLAPDPRGELSLSPPNSDTWGDAPPARLPQ